MASRRRSGARRSTRFYGRARSTRAPASRKRSYAAKSTRRASRRTAGVGRTVRIVIEQPSANPMARPDLIGKMPVQALVRRNKSAF